MKSVRAPKTGILHIETELGVINVFLGLRDSQGRRTERIEVSCNAFAGTPPVTIEGKRKRGIGFRMIEKTNH